MTSFPPVKELFTRSQFDFTLLFQQAPPAFLSGRFSFQTFYPKTIPLDDSFTN